MDPYLSSIYLFGGNFSIYGFALCAGQILPISSNTALFSLIGTYYGGNGSSSFGLPDLRGRTAICQGTGAPGVSPYSIGEVTGTENETMLYSNMPIHNHAANAQIIEGTSALPAGSYFSQVKTGQPPRQQIESFYNAGPSNVTINPASTSVAGGSVPFNIQQPELAISAMIALRGIFPARN
jgi:microcystin-dependent protein